MNNDQVVSLTEQYVLPTYARWPIAPVKAEGHWLTDADGRRYLDFVGGVAVTSQGHCHPKVVAAIKKQAEQLIHCSNLFHIPGQALLAKRLVEASGLKKAFFCNSGAEANEAALKLARKWGKQHKNGAFQVVVAEDSFHGRTMGALSATMQSKYQTSFTPLVPGFQNVPYGDLSALQEAAGPEVAAILLEPLQAEGGVKLPPVGYFEGAAKLAKQQNILLILDEVQTGLGRTGKLFAFQHYGIKPDLLTLAKALGGGVPIGAMLVGERALDTLQPGDHASTFGGGPLATAAALAALDVIEDGLVENCARVGAYLRQKLLVLQQTCPAIKEVRGQGLLIGMELSQPASPVVAACREHGLLILTAGERVLRLLPPLTITQAEVDQAVQILQTALQRDY